MSKQNLDSRIKEYTYNLYAGSEYKFNKKLSLSASVSLEFYKMMNYKNGPYTLPYNLDTLFPLSICYNFHSTPTRHIQAIG